MLADSIRIDLCHMKDEGNPDSKLQADAEIKAALGMNRQGFKWKTLLNDPETGRRY